MTKYRQNRLFWIVTIIGLILDQLTKYLVAQTFSFGQTLPLLPGVFHLTYVSNTGAAFSLLSGKIEWLRWFSLGFSLALMASAWFSSMRTKEVQFGLGFLLAGTLGNTVDRFLLGYIIDFLDFRLTNLPVFNLADLLITMGIAFMFVNFFRPISSS
ncbi:signal peptidase II (plasmid) [Nostoc sp. UHCC 0926]|uniref:signal peptidase II n=1 Tax=Nostoc sp. UHCC 0926 TaxID=3025190 RepID=UPI00235E8BBF|nr:signal peptidase II [Nostoc sp. UHCC 0926]WDD36274.1 signal peptidase II [Nostoc sp. UHCC 0926]